MQRMEIAMAVLFPDTGFRQKCLSIRCYDFSALQTSLQTQKGHALARLNGHGVDYRRSFTTGQ